MVYGAMLIGAAVVVVYIIFLGGVFNMSGHDSDEESKRDNNH
jgi:hypothetical protein